LASFDFTGRRRGDLGAASSQDREMVQNAACTALESRPKRKLATVELGEGGFLPPAPDAHKNKKVSRR
jgi:hypothetical protein